MDLRGAAIAAAVVLVLASGCQDDSPSATGSAPTPTTRASASPSDPEVIDVAGLPLGAPPEAPYIAGDVLHWRGRATPVALPDDGWSLTILGAVDGRVVLDTGDRFWAVGRDGALQPLGHAAYSSYDYGPRLVARTGHIWVHHTDRTTRRILWEIDARTGQDLGVWRHGADPQDLAAPDQALVDSWAERREAVSGLQAPSADHSLVALVVGPRFGGGVAVQRASDHEVVAQFAFGPPNQPGDIDRVLFEDADHVLVLTTVSSTRRHGPEQVIVRCSVSTGDCERATEVGGLMSLGVIRPGFVRSRTERRSD